MSISGGIDWSEIYVALRIIGLPSQALFMVFILISFLAVVNVVTGVFVDVAQQMAQQDRDLVVQQQLAEKEAYMRELKNLFYEADCDDSGSLSWEEFETHCDDARVMAYLSTLDLDPSEARGLFTLLDYNDSGEVSINEFVNGCIRLKGSAKSIDLCTLLYDCRKMALKIDGLEAALKSHMYPSSVHQCRARTKSDARDGKRNGEPRPSGEGTVLGVVPSERPRAIDSDDDGPPLRGAFAVAGGYGAFAAVNR